MSEFLTPLNVILVQHAGWYKRTHWRLSTDFVYESDLIGTVTVPAGTITDFASVPRLPLIFSFVGDSVYRPAVIHDHLYHSADAWPRKLCDGVFLEAMAVARTPVMRRHAMYYAVRAFGWVAYWRHANENETSRTTR